MSDFDLNINTDALLSLARGFEKGGQIVSEEMMKAMIASLTVIESNVVTRTPVFLGALRSSIATEIFGKPLGDVFFGQTATSIVYGLEVEEGREPGSMPPVDALAFWAKRKFGLTDEQAAGVGFIVAEKIEKFGTRGYFMFERGFEASETRVFQIWDSLPANIVERLV